MDKKAVVKILSQFRAILKAKGIRISKLILFGSYAAGNDREGSDIDVVVISRDFIGKNYWERIEILSDAIYEIFQPIEAIAMTPDEWKEGNSPIIEFAKNGEIVES
ncbi:MAG: nucleotidyltransferase domain-containing protein [Phycisphaerae bacterium]